MAVDKNDKTAKRYHEIWELVLLYLALGLAMAACVFGFPFILKLVYRCFENFGWFLSGGEIIDTNGQVTDNRFLGLLPDFLGGLCGIIISFLLDAWIINKIRRINNYRDLKKVIQQELKEYMVSLRRCATMYECNWVNRSQNAETFYVRLKMDNISLNNLEDMIKMSQDFGLNTIKELLKSADARNTFYRLPHLIVGKSERGCNMFGKLEDIGEYAANITEANGKMWYVYNELFPGFMSRKTISLSDTKKNIIEMLLSGWYDAYQKIIKLQEELDKLWGEQK